MAIKISGTTVIDDSQGLRITGISTFTNGPVLVGSATSTGTASQLLQVTGGAYVSGSVGIGTTNPSSTLSVGGTITELYAGQYWNLVSQADIGIGASQVPLNQYLGQLAFLDSYSPSGLRRDGGGADDVTVNSSGFVGVGTTNSSNPFQVNSGSTIVLVDSSGDLGIGTPTAPSKLYLQGNAAANIVGLGTTSGTVTLDFTQGNNFSLNLSANATLANPTGVTTGQSGVILIQENSTGGYSVAWGSSWDFASATAPTLTTTASALNALPYFARSTTSIVVGSVIAGIGTL